MPHDNVAVTTGCVECLKGHVAICAGNVVFSRSCCNNCSVCNVTKEHFAKTARYFGCLRIL